MPEDERKEIEKIEKQEGEGIIANEAVMAQMLRISSGNQFNPTDEQVDKIIGLQEKGMDYTHDERTRYLPNQILTFASFVIIVLVLVGIFIFSSFYAPQYLDSIIAAILGLVAGGAGGYGYGISKSGKRD